MSKLQTVLEIARWEFFRWFKWKDQFFTLGFSLLLGVAIWGGQSLVEKTAADKIRIVILNPEADSINVSAEGRMEFTTAGVRTEEELRESLTRHEIDGILIVRNLDEAELIVAKEPV